ncbi:PREDICTED: expansin-A22 [Camelina sativa]|uniref:Expansin n=1 Tax=Camelina sativa TaxID=90675 RepID=A0ABM0U4V1_CAMSA|nr:PREDICTED: expansin-A22 [Camelina sativa]
MKLSEKLIYVEFLMIIMAMWVVPIAMSYGHVAEVPETAEAPEISGSARGRSFDTNWYDARATFYGDIHGGDTQQGACGYGNLFRQGYGLATAALSTALFNDGYTCGACFEIMCTNDPQWCLPGSIKITATNFCPPNYTKTTDIWCNPPQKHFDLSLAMFLKIAKYKAGVVPVRYRRVLCRKTGGVKFETQGNQYFLMILPYNVGGAGDIKYMQVKGNKTGWITMRKNWGQHWTTGVVLTGQALSFRVTTSDGITKDFWNVVPKNWGFGQTFDGRINF